MTGRKLDLGAVATAIGPPLADAVLDGEARLDPVSVPGIEATVVWRVRDVSGPHPWQAYVGAWPDGAVRVLTADQDAWSDLVAATGAQLMGVTQARSYVETFLEVTRGAMVIVRVVTSVDDLPWRPGSDEEEAARASLLADPPVFAPLLSPTSDGFHVELTRTGVITGTSFRVLAEHLPLPIAR